MGRPRGVKDSKKRKQRNQHGFSQAEIDIIKTLKQNHVTTQKISDWTGLSIAQIKKICNQNDIKQINPKDLIKKSDILLDSDKKICGIYIITINRKDGYLGIYVGSSVNIVSRCLQHKNDLEKNKHYNKRMQIDFNNCICVNFKVWSEEKEEDLLQKESEIISKYYGLYNKNKNNTLENFKVILEKSLDKINESKYIVQENGCWFYNKTHINGYGRDIKTRHDGKIYYIKPHRLSYYKYKKEYPELIRHICNNRNCINPEHLDCGSVSQNNNDKYKEFNELFKIKWKEFNGNYIKLTEFFNRKKNYKNRYNSQIPIIAKKLGLI